MNNIIKDGIYEKIHISNNDNFINDSCYGSGCICCSTDFIFLRTSYGWSAAVLGSVRMEFGTATTHQGKITYGQVSAAGDSRISIFKNVLVLPVEEAYRNIFVTVSSKGLTYNLPFGSISAGKNHAYRVRNYDSANYTVTSFKDTW